VQKRKIAIISKALVPDISLLDPLPLTTLPPEVTVHCGMDVLSHAIEAYVSNASSPVTDLHARQATDLIVRSLPGAVERPDDIDARFATMMASLHAGLAFSNASLGAVHALAHALGGYLDLSHGLANALLLESVVAFNYAAAPDRYDEIGRIMQAPPDSGKEAIVSRIRAFRSSLGIAGTIADAGCERSDIPSLAARAIADPCLATNPKDITLEDIGRIYEAAF